MIKPFARMAWSLFILFYSICVIAAEIPVAHSRTLPSGECADVRVNAADPWNRSGLLLEQGMTYRFQVKSIDEPWVDDNIPSDPRRGWTTWKRFLFWPLRFLARYPSSNWYTLIGAIGEQREYFFYIGDSARITVSASGEFMSFANDMIGRYYNNHGRLSLQVCSEGRNTANVPK